MQRHLQTAGKLSAECIARLDELGFVWEPIDATWETRFAELRRYKDMYGDCNVPQGWAENPQLGSWVSVQCTFQKKGKLSPAHKHRLDELGFDWDPYDSFWETMFAGLGRYRERLGHCNVTLAENPQLAGWAYLQRSQKRKGALSAVRKARLDALGFWSRKKVR
jgi:hypothetical protein